MQGALIKGAPSSPPPPAQIGSALSWVIQPAASFVVSCASLLTSFRAEDCCSPPLGPGPAPWGGGQGLIWTPSQVCTAVVALSIPPCLPTHQPALVRGFLQTCPAPESL